MALTHTEGKIILKDYKTHTAQEKWKAETESRYSGHSGQSVIGGTAKRKRKTIAPRLCNRAAAANDQIRESLQRISGECEDVEDADGGKLQRDVNRRLRMDTNTSISNRVMPVTERIKYYLVKRPLSYIFLTNGVWAAGPGDVTTVLTGIHSAGFREAVRDRGGYEGAGENPDRILATMDRLKLKWEHAVAVETTELLAVKTRLRCSRTATSRHHLRKMLFRFKRRSVTPQPRATGTGSVAIIADVPAPNRNKSNESVGGKGGGSSSQAGGGWLVATAAEC